MRINIPLEMIFMIGVFLLMVSMLIYGGIIKRILILIQKGGIWILPVIGGVVLLIVLIIHLYRISYYGASLSHADPEDLFPLILGMLKMRSVEAWTMLVAGFFGFLGAGLYYNWLRR